MTNFEPEQKLEWEEQLHEPKANKREKGRG